MFNSILQFLYNGIQAVFTWFQSLFNSMPGSWDFLFSFIAIYFVLRFILGPLVGTISGGLGSDHAGQSRDKSFNLRTRVKPTRKTADPVSSAQRSK